MRVKRGRDYGQIWMINDREIGQYEFDDYHYGIPAHGYIKTCNPVSASIKTNVTAEVEWNSGNDINFFRKWHYIGGELNGIKRYDLQIVSGDGT